MHALAEFARGCDAVIADGGDAKPLRTNSICVLFQLHELGFAVRSPVARTVENQQRTFRSQHRRQIARGALLVLEAEVERLLPNGGTGWKSRRRRGNSDEARKQQARGSHTS